MATYTAPTTITLSSNLNIPGAALLLSWSGANPGSDIIQGYIIQYSDNNTNWIDYATYITDNTFGESIVELPNNRGAVRYFRVGIYGTTDETIIYSTVVNCKVNRKPKTPLVFTHDNNGNERLIVPWNDNNGDNILNKVYYTITKNLEDDDLIESQTLYYSIGNASAPKTLISTTGYWVTTHTTDLSTQARYFIFAYDGLEYSEPINVNIIINQLPIITGYTLTPNFNVIGPDNSIMCTSLKATTNASGSHSLNCKYRIKYSANKEFTNPTYSGYLYTTNIIMNEVTIPLNVIENRGKYFRIEVEVHDQIFNDDYSNYIDNSSLYWYPKTPDINNLTFKIGAYNPSKTGEARFLSLSDTEYNSIYQYRNKFYYGVNDFTSKTNAEGYGKIVKAKIFYNFESINGNGKQNSSIYTLTLTNNNYTYSNNDRKIVELNNNMYSVVYCGIELTDEFNVTYSYYSDRLVKNEDALTSNLLTLNYTSFAPTKTGLSVYDICYNSPNKIVKFIFTKLNTYLPNSFIPSKWISDISYYINYSFLGQEITINSDSASCNDVNANTEISLDCGNNIDYLLTDVTKSYNSIKTTIFSLRVRDIFGDIHNINTTNNISMDFRDTPRILISSGDPINFYYTYKPTTPITTTWYVYPEEKINLKYNIANVFGDRNLENNSENARQLETIIRLYEGNELLYTNNNTGWIATGWAESPVFELNSQRIAHLFSSEGNLRSLQMRIAARDGTGLESPERVIGNLILTPRIEPTLFKLNYLNYTTNDRVIEGSYDCELNRFVYNTNDYNIVTVKTYIIPNSGISGTVQNDILTFDNNIINVVDRGTSKFNLAAIQEKITLSNAQLVLEITYYDGKIIKYYSNSVRVLADIPLISARKKAISINQLFENINNDNCPNAEIYIYANDLEKNKVYFEYQGPKSSIDNSPVHNLICIDLLNARIDGAIIDGGTWQ